MCIRDRIKTKPSTYPASNTLNPKSATDVGMTTTNSPELVMALTRISIVDSMVVQQSSRIRKCARPIPQWPIPMYSGFNCLQDVHISEGVLVEVVMPNQFKLILVSIYIHPQTPLNYIKMVLFRLMLYYTKQVRTIVINWP